MIKIEALLDDDGVLKACKACGHSGAGKAGNDIVCAAVSVLIRTTVSTLSNRNGITVNFDAPERGQLWLETQHDAEGKDFLCAVGEFLINGLSSVAGEYPENCKLTVKKC
ncbi:MAG: ribosomal-processing cysteine protease Prp [Treponema sp.]|nr:ribosomal-processing cysteine protease Prp [Treponema sp.]